MFPSPSVMTFAPVALELTGHVLAVSAVDTRIGGRGGAKDPTRGMNRLGLLFASDPRFGAKVDGPPLPQ
jgi:hypothetical protein